MREIRLSETAFNRKAMDTKKVKKTTLILFAHFANLPESLNSRHLGHSHWRSGSLGSCFVSFHPIGNAFNSICLSTGIVQNTRIERRSRAFVRSTHSRLNSDVDAYKHIYSTNATASSRFPLNSHERFGVVPFPCNARVYACGSQPSVLLLRMYV